MFNISINCDHDVQFNQIQRSPIVNDSPLLSGQRLRSQSSILRWPEGNQIPVGRVLDSLLSAK